MKYLFLTMWLHVSYFHMNITVPRQHRLNLIDSVHTTLYHLVFLKSILTHVKLLDKGMMIYSPATIFWHSFKQWLQSILLIRKWGIFYHSAIQAALANSPGLPNGFRLYLQVDCCCFLISCFIFLLSSHLSHNQT